MSFDSIKKSFFDTKLVTSTIEKNAKRALSRIGAIARRKAKSSLKYKGRHEKAAPGMPPLVHRETSSFRMMKNVKGAKKLQQVSPLRELTFFSYDAARTSVVVGPVPFGGGTGPNTLRTIEYGGSGHYAHPWMGPAMDATMPEAKVALTNVAVPR